MQVREADRAGGAVHTMGGLSVPATSKLLVLLQCSDKNVRVFALTTLPISSPSCSLIREHNSSLFSSILGTQQDCREYTLYSLTYYLIKKQASVACASVRVGSRDSRFHYMTIYLRHSLLEHNGPKIRYYL